MEYDIPEEVVAEGIVNAVAHRDYTSNGSVEVQLFPDRLEIWNPGTVHPPLTLKKLLQPHASQPNNPLIAEPLFLTKYIEKAGTGTIDMLDHCRRVGIRLPEFRIDSGYFIVTLWRRVTAKISAELPGIESQIKAEVSRDQVGIKSALTRHQVEILRKCLIETGITELMKIAGRSDRTKFRNQVLNPLLRDGLLEMTIPDKPNSRLQKYRLTKKGEQFLKENG